VAHERVNESSGGDNLRKYLIAALAATAAVGVGTTAYAQGGPDGATLKVTVAPKNAGTAKKPVNSSVHFVATNNNSKRSLRKLDIQMPKTLKVSAKGFKFCNRGKLESSADPSVCPKASKVGGGVAKAFLGVNTANPTPLTFDVKAFVVAKDRVDFSLHARELPSLFLVSPGKVTNTKKGPKLTVTVPEQAQQPAPGVYAGLAQLDTTLKGKAGSHKLIASTGCKKGKQPFSTKLYFSTNPVSSATTITASASSKCS
jgi:hypothetical protein